MPSAAILISSIPSFVSREEHTTLASQTPASFADIPPVLRLKQEGVTVRFEPPLDGFSEQDSAEGTLFVIESVLVFMSTTGRGWQIEYPSITLHAMSRGEAGPSIYCQLDESVGSSNDDGDAEMRELSIIPMDATSLEPIFDALSHCATLHPDKADEDAMADDDADEAFVDMDDAFEPFTGEGGQELSQAGRDTLERFEDILTFADKEDAERDDEEEGVKTPRIGAIKEKEGKKGKDEEAKT